MKVLSFLGTGDYKETTYTKHDDETQSYKTDLFPKAVANLYEPIELVVFVTSIVREDKKGYLKDLRESISSQLRIEDIPNGNSETDLWRIFQVCADAVDVNDEIILDITHAFRSLPLLIFIVAAYLRQVKQVKLKHLIYGAYEARDENTNQTPIFDLTPFVELLDWMNAFNIFQRFGDAREIAKLDLPNNIERPLTNVSAALLTNRTFEAQEEVSKFVNMNLAHPESLLRQPVPFRILAEELKKSYQNIGVVQPRDNPKQSLKAQSEQIKWYVENQHYLQAITLMREWIVSWECLQLNQGNWLNQQTRKETEDALNERIDAESSSITKELAPLVSSLISTNLWRKCRDLRNDFAHCGIRQDPRRSYVAIKATQHLLSEFEEFVQHNLN